jgi:Cu/Ag efflux pump CusA
VFALAVRQGVVLIARAQYLRRRRGAVFGPELVLTATRERLVPILTANVVTAVAMLPFLAAGDVAGNEIVRAMAVVVLGGLVTSTLLILLIVPALYVHYGREAAALFRWRQPSTTASPAAGPQESPADAG